MPNPPEGMRLCPTRTDGEASLIAHVIALTECQKRQREYFHKCPTCFHNNDRDPRSTLAPAKSATREQPKPLPAN